MPLYKAIRIYTHQMMVAHLFFITLYNRGIIRYPEMSDITRNEWDNELSVDTEKTAILSRL
jgi:hypothetical protein